MIVFPYCDTFEGLLFYIRYPVRSAHFFDRVIFILCSCKIVKTISLFVVFLV
jgi:hypothetical protein